MFLSCYGINIATKLTVQVWIDAIAFTKKYHDATIAVLVGSKGACLRYKFLLNSSVPHFFKIKNRLLGALGLKLSSKYKLGMTFNPHLL